MATIKGKTQDGENMTITIDYNQIAVIGDGLFYMGEIFNEYGCKRTILEQIDTKKVFEKKEQGVCATYFEVI